MGCASGKQKEQIMQQVKSQLAKRDMSGLKFKSQNIRNNKNWTDLLDEAVKWINQNTIVTNIFAISIIFCNYNKERLLHIRYDQSAKGEAEEEMAAEIIASKAPWGEVHL